MSIASDSTHELTQRLLQDGLLASPSATLTPLTGGVSSDIYRVQDGDRVFVVKQALAKLRVQDDWQADLSRNDFERAYIDYVGKLEPAAVPRLLGGGKGYFAMEFLGDGFANWKQLLLQAEILPIHAALAGRTLGRIHAASTEDSEAERRFASTANFRQLRTAPYLRTTGDRHPELRDHFNAEADRLEATRDCLVHGDYSPKNLLIKSDRLVILDSEVAWFGDGAFDLAFLLNHLLLKALYHAPQSTVLPELVMVARRTYFEARALIGQDVTNQHALDTQMRELDGTPNKSRLGANAILAVSTAAVAAHAAGKGLPLFEVLGELGGQRGTTLPLPEIQIIGGGAHANWRTDVQDFLLMATGAHSYEETLEITFNVYHAAGDIFKEQNKYYGLADEGGFWPEFATNEEVFATMVEAIERAGYTPGKDAAISLDIAASDLYDEATGQYRFRLEDRTFSSEEFVDQMIAWCEKYPVVSIEDPAADTDWAGWKRFYQALGDRVQVVGDDLFTTNLERIQTGIEKGVANSVLIKLNQIGTVSETLEAIKLTQDAGWAPLVSARSGETEDAFISHLSVGTNAGQLKVGSFARSERMVKWNECLRIGHQLGDSATFLGAKVLPGN